MNKHKDRHVAVVEKHKLDGASTITLMKHKHKGYTHEWRHHDYYHVMLRWLPSTPIYKMNVEWEAAKDQGSFRPQTSLGRSYL